LENRKKNLKEINYYICFVFKNRSAMRVLIFVFTLLLGLVIFSCNKKVATPYTNLVSTKGLVDDSAMVASAHPVATQIGIDILRKGGNAVDAAIAVQFALAVVYPVAGNLGGGGFMVYRKSNGETATLDYREMAPSAATRDMYLDEKGNPTTKSLYGHLASGVPGTVAGMYEAYLKYSKLKNWEALVAPALDVAKNGVALTEKEATGFNERDSLFTRINGRKTVFNHMSWMEGDLLVQPELAKTLKAIKDNGRDGFYRGNVADEIVKEMKSGGGIMTHQDLINYKAIWRKPIESTYRGYKIIGMPPPSSGGIAMTQLLRSVEPYNLKNLGFQSPEYIHLLVEAERRVYADRSTHLGDADFYKVPQKGLTAKAYTDERMKSFDPMKATTSAEIKAGDFTKESEQTTHYSIVDQYGNAVSMTTTLNGGYGSYVVIDGAGFIMNNEMDDFSVKPGTANMYGLIGAEANKIEPGKRMLSSMTPTIIEKNGKLAMVVGTPGGSTIITSVFQTILNVLEFGMSAESAVSSPRFHHQWVPDFISIEKDKFNPEVLKKLEEKGHVIRTRGAIGRVEAIVVTDNGKLQGGADPRGDDDVRGF
jgi:gamma-glutamyltranspeptidase / glutathione hydrolase